MDATLVIFRKNGRRKDIPLKKGVSVIGRRADCDVYIPHIFVSRKHCRIVRKDDTIVVQDLGSANGTFINSERIMEGVLNAGDVLAVGSFTFTIAVNGKPEVIKPPKPVDIPAPPPKKAKKTESSLSSGTSSAIAMASASGSASAMSATGSASAVAMREPLDDPLSDLEPLAGDFDLDDSSTYQSLS